MGALTDFQARQQFPARKPCMQHSRASNLRAASDHILYSAPKSAILNHHLHPHPQILTGYLLAAWAELAINQQTTLLPVAVIQSVIALFGGVTAHTS